MSRLGLRRTTTQAAQVYAHRRQLRDARRRSLFAPPPPKPPAPPPDISGAEAAAKIRQTAADVERKDPKLAAALRGLADTAERGRSSDAATARQTHAIAGGGLDRSLPRGDRDEEG